MSNSRIFLFLMLAFILGVFSGSFFDISQKTALIIGILAASLIAVFYRRGTKILNPRITLIAFLTIAFVLGVLRFDISESATKALTNFNDTNTNISLSGYINDEPQRLEARQRLLVQVKEVRAAGFVLPLDEKVLVTTNLYPEYEYGDLVLVEGKPQSPKNFYPVKSGSPDLTGRAGVAEQQFNRVNDFDYINYLAKDGIFSLVYYPRIEKITLQDFHGDEAISNLEKIKISLFKNIFKVKNAFEDSIERSVPEPNAAFINGILLGSRESIPQELKDAFNKTSTTHIMAISGYNITIIALYVSALFLFFMRRQLAFWFTILAIGLFVILTGAQASVIRAAIMGVLVLIAYREGRFYNMTNAIVFAGAAMIAVNPKVLQFDVGFQLSFLATLGLIYLAPFLQKKLEKLPRLWTFKENFVSTISAQAMVLPIILYNFANFSPFSVPANILVLPFIPLTMFFGFVSGIAGLVWSRLGEIFGWAAWLLSGYEILIIKIFSSLG